MRERLRSYVTYANAMASIAVFFALGAGAYGAGLAPDSVLSHHIVNGEVRSIDVADHGLTGTDIRADTVAGTSRGLVYDLATDGTSKRLATVRIGSEEWEFTGACVGVDDGFFTLLGVDGPALSRDRRFEAFSLNNNQATVRVGFPPNYSPLNNEIAAIKVTGGVNVIRSAGTTFLSRGRKLMRVDFNLVARASPKPTCSIRGTVTPAA